MLSLKQLLKCTLRISKLNLINSKADDSVLKIGRNAMYYHKS